MFVRVFSFFLLCWEENFSAKSIWHSHSHLTMDTIHTAVIVIEKLERKIELLKRDINKVEGEDDDDEVVECRRYAKVKLSALEKSLARAYKALDD